MHLLNLSASNVHLLLLPIHSKGLIFNASIEQAQSELLGGVVFGNAQVTRKVFESNSMASHSHNYCCLSLQSLVALMWSTHSMTLFSPQPTSLHSRTSPLLTMMCWNLMKC